MAQFSLQVTLEINLVLERLIMFLSKTLVTVWWERTSDLFQRRQYSSEAVCTSNQNKYPCNDLLHAASSASLFHVLTSVNVHKSAQLLQTLFLFVFPRGRKVEERSRNPKHISTSHKSSLENTAVTLMRSKMESRVCYLQNN